MSNKRMWTSYRRVSTLIQLIHECVVLIHQKDDQDLYVQKNGENARSV